MRSARLLRAPLILIALACVACGPPPDDGTAPSANAPVDAPSAPEVEATIELCDASVAAPDDPGASVDGWSAVGGAVIDYEGVGALFLSAAVCAGDAEMRKTVALPECFLPLALDVESNIIANGSFGPLDATGVQLGDALMDFGYQEFQTRRCVGAAAFRGAVDLVIRPRTAYSLCEEAIGEIARVSLTPERACPAPGTITPFDDGTWTLYADQGAVAEVIDGDLRLHIDAGTCAGARAEGPSIGALALPDAPGAGIRVFVEADDADVEPEDADGALYMRIGRMQAALHAGENVICLPRPMRGSTNRIDFNLTHESCSSSFAPERSALVRELEMIDGCPETDVVDGSFDEGSPLWHLLPMYQPGSARIEGGAAILEATHQCDAPRLDGTIAVPPSTADAGPALVVVYTLDGVGSGGVQLGDVNLYAELSVDANEARICLPPGRANDLLALSIQATTETGGSGTCATPALGPTVLTVDEVRVELDPACPAT